MRIWLINHFAGGMFFEHGSRHYNFAKYLKRQGYESVVFCANSKHGISDTFFPNTSLWHEHMAEEINVPFVFVKARTYEDNGKQRVLNMVDFYSNAQKAAKEYAALYGKPDVILASSVHPLTLVAGIKLAKYFGVKCICEVRDLWPESIVAYSDKWTKNNPIIKCLYAGEKWLYKKADKIIMTWPGGYDYIKERGWDRFIPERKVVHICNGIDLPVFKENIAKYPCNDEILKDRRIKFVYTGSIRKVNNLGLIVEAAEKVKSPQALLLIYGDGDERETLEQQVREKGMTNIIFKGSVAKNLIPSILSQCDVTLLHNSSTSLNKYGQSQNKFFEYLASGKPIIMTYAVGHSIVKQYGCGLELEEQTAESIAAAIDLFCHMDRKTYQHYAEQAAFVAKSYDYQKLTDELIKVIEECH